MGGITEVILFSTSLPYPPTRLRLSQLNVSHPRGSARLIFAPPSPEDHAHFSHLVTFPF